MRRYETHELVGDTGLLSAIVLQAVLDLKSREHQQEAAEWLQSRDNRILGCKWFGQKSYFCFWLSLLQILLYGSWASKSYGFRSHSGCSRNDQFVPRAWSFLSLSKAK
jgi:hypothetical protein